MMRTLLLLCALTTTFPLVAACQPAREPGADQRTATAPVAAPARATAPALPDTAEDRLYRDAAERAWRWIDRNYRPATGLIRATDQYSLVTTWDIGSGLLAMHSAHELGLLADAEYEVRMSRALRTLQALPLYDRTAFGRFYSVDNAQMYGRDERPTERGYGWSATDLGRLLTALHVVAGNPRFQADAQAIVARLDFAKVVREGYLWGEDVRPNGRVAKYTEGRIGYEQYAARGYALWGHPAERALRLAENAQPATVEGVRVLGDRRGDERLTSEPFILAGLETGLAAGGLEELASGVLAAQEARWRRTGQVTVVSEDAIPLPPYYFYYYTVLHGGRPWVVDAQAPMAGVRAPRWISTKATFAWHAILPGDYTRTALQTVASAHRGQADWAAGVYEGGSRLTGGSNVNTAAVILEAALYRQRGRPLAAR
jgi:hypothetical protein